MKRRLTNAHINLNGSDVCIVPPFIHSAEIMKQGRGYILTDMRSKPYIESRLLPLT